MAAVTTNARITAAIRIGDDFERAYEFYDPLPETGKPDLTSPQDISGKSFRFVLKHGSKNFTAPTDGGTVSVTSSPGKVTIKIPRAVTALFNRDESTSSYLIQTVTATGAETSILEQSEAVLPRGEIDRRR